MSNEYDVERMLNRLVDDGPEIEDNRYSWQKNSNYRDRDTKNLSVDDLIDTISSAARGKHEAPPKKVKPVRSSEKSTRRHFVEQEIIYRSPYEVQQKADAAEDEDSRTYLNNMLDRMEREIAAMERENKNPLKPRVIRPESEPQNDADIALRERNIKRLKTKKKFSEPEFIEPDREQPKKAAFLADPEPEETAKTSRLPEAEDIPESDFSSEPETAEKAENIADYDNLNKAENEAEEEFRDDELIEENIIPDDENLLADIESKELEENQNKIQKELEDFSKELQEAESRAIVEEPEEKKKKKGFFSRLFSKKQTPEDEFALENYDDLQFGEEDDFFGDEDLDKSNDEINSRIEELSAEDPPADEYYDTGESEEESTEPEYAEPETEYTEPEEKKIIDEDEYIARHEKKDDEYDDNADESKIEENINDPDDEEVLIEAADSCRDKSGKYFPFGVVVLIFAVIGLFSVLFVCAKFIYSSAVDSSLKKSIEKLVYPPVTGNISDFDKIEELNDTEIITSSILFILQNGNLTEYNESMETLTVPQQDVESAAKEIFGEDVQIGRHQNTGAADVTFYYDENGKVYSVPKNPLIYTSKPKINSIQKKKNGYTAEVIYVTDYPDWIEERNGRNVAYNKVVLYDILKDESGKLHIEAAAEVQ